ncbi:MAG: hypothetical protein V4671_12860 [Armatimonadota bacterium]
MSVNPALRIADVTPILPPAPDGAILFANDFDRPLDRARYFEHGDAKGSFVWDPSEGMGASGAMRCTFQKGQVAAGDLKILFGRNPFRRGVRQSETFGEIYWRVYVKHEVGWQGNPAKLSRATTMAGSDWSQGLMAHVWGGSGEVLCIDPASGITDGVKKSVRYNDFEHLRWLGVRQGRTPIFSPVESGRWVCIESRVRINTPGKKDGIFTLWVDGREEAHRADLDWHGSWNEWGINAVFLENYWNRGSVRRQSRWFDNFMVSTKQIGPILTSSAPTLTRTSTSVGPWDLQLASDFQGRDIVWTSGTSAANVSLRRVERIEGKFMGSHQGYRALLQGGVYWGRVRERSAPTWSDWHSPFRVK